MYEKESPIFSPSQETNTASTINDCSKRTPPCLHDGKLVDGVCKCPKGYKGSRCEYSTCHNYCFNNNQCETRQDGLPVCKCTPGWTGPRCEIDQCRGFCANNGLCVVENNDKEPTCKCASGFSGRRCEVETNVMDKLCTVYCAVENLTREHYLNEETAHTFKIVMDSISQKSSRVCRWVNLL